MKENCMKTHNVKIPETLSPGVRPTLANRYPILGTGSWFDWSVGGISTASKLSGSASCLKNQSAF